MPLLIDSLIERGPILSYLTRMFNTVRFSSMFVLMNMFVLNIKFSEAFGVQGHLDIYNTIICGRSSHCSTILQAHETWM